MPRPKRICAAGEVFHVRNRGVARLTLFEKPEDYDAFLRVLEGVWDEIPLSLPVQSDEQLLTVLRYVERNPVRAGLAERAELWRWSSAGARAQKPSARPRWLGQPSEPTLPRRWLAWVNEPQTDAELKTLRNCIRRSCPFGDEAWASSSAARLNLQSTRRPRGRPKKES